jgi:hypothetical protein
VASNPIVAAVGTVDLLGASTGWVSAATGWEGVHIEPLADTTLQEFGFFVNLGVCDGIDFTIYSDDGSGWELARTGHQATPPEGMGYLRAPSGTYPLRAGNQYMLGIGWRIGCDVQVELGDLAVGTSLGAVRYLGHASAPDLISLPTPVASPEARKSAMVFP